MKCQNVWIDYNTGILWLRPDYFWLFADTLRNVALLYILFLETHNNENRPAHSISDMRCMQSFFLLYHMPIPALLGKEASSRCLCWFHFHKYVILSAFTSFPTVLLTLVAQVSLAFFRLLPVTTFLVPMVCLLVCLLSPPSIIHGLSAWELPCILRTFPQTDEGSVVPFPVGPGVSIHMFTKIEAGL